MAALFPQRNYNLLLQRSGEERGGGGGEVREKRGYGWVLIMKPFLLLYYPCVRQREYREGPCSGKKETRYEGMVNAEPLNCLIMIVIITTIMMIRWRRRWRIIIIIIMIIIIIIMMMMMMIIIIIIIMSVLKGAIRDFVFFYCLNSAPRTVSNMYGQVARA